MYKRLVQSAWSYHFMDYGMEYGISWAYAWPYRCLMGDYSYLFSKKGSDLARAEVSTKEDEAQPRPPTTSVAEKD